MHIRARQFRSAFTLVELLVVIAIIGILIGILLPVLSRVRARATATQCASNLRQLATGWQYYANAYGGTSCPMRLPEVGGNPLQDLGKGPHYRPRWFDCIGAQMRSYAYRKPPQTAQDDDEPLDNSAFLCPTESDWRNGRNYAYGYNYQFLGNPRIVNGKFINFPVRAGRIKAAATVMAADSMGTAAGKPKSSRKPYLVDGSSDKFALGNHGYTIDPPRLTDACDYCEDESRNPPDRSAPDPRHNKRANVAFCDGHVEAMTLEEMGYIVRPDGSVGAKDPGAQNRLFSGTDRDDDPPPVP